jgi:hypothetical protein
MEGHLIRRMARIRPKDIVLRVDGEHLSHETGAWYSNRSSLKLKFRVLFVRVRNMMVAMTLFSCSCNAPGSRPVTA